MAFQEAILQVTAISILFSIYSTALLRKFVLTPEYMKQMEIHRKISSELMEARKKKDSKTLKKLEKKYEMTAKSVQGYMVKYLVFMFISFASFIALFNLINPIYAPIGNKFMTLPIPIPFIGSEINYFTWFIIVSFLFSRILSKALKIG